MAPNLHFENLLNNTATVYRDGTPTSDGQGGWTSTNGSVANISVRVSVGGGSEKRIAYLDARQITHVVYCMPGSNVKRGDKLVIAEKNLELQVLDVKEPSLMGHHLELECREIQHG